MGKYAVIIGVNYVKNPKAALRGCCNDARIMHGIIQSKGFEDENIKLLVDDDDSCDSPDHVNVKRALDWLCSDREEGDVIFLHFSGHGTQIPCDGDDYEPDALDEAIVLEEIFLMADDDLKQYFSKLPPGARATVVMDCCHSGSMLDGDHVVIEGAKDEDSEEQMEESEELLEALGRGKDEDGGESSRSLPINLISEIMSEKLGTDVPATGNGINGAMAQLFGGNSGKLMMKFALSQMQKQGIPEDSPIMGIATMVLGSMMGGGGGGGGGGGARVGGDPLSQLFGGGAGALLSSLFGGDKPEEEQEAPPPPPPSGDPNESVASMMAQMGLQGTAPSAGAGPPYNPMHGAVPKEVCTLVTGCQADETSADVRLADGNAFGALTKTLSDIQQRHPSISSYELVTSVRRSLSKAGYSQNPCLETSESLAGEVFICEDE